LPTGPAAARVGVTAQTLRRWEKEGRIAAVRTPGGNRRYRVEDLDKLLDDGQAALKPAN
jgi:putative resolvase